MIGCNLKDLPLVHILVKIGLSTDRSAWKESTKKTWSGPEAISCSSRNSSLLADAMIPMAVISTPELCSKRACSFVLA